MVNLTAIGAVAGAMTARHAAGSLTMGGIDLLSGLASQSILSFAYTDNTSDMADDLSIEIADPQRTWMKTYLPKKGADGQALIKVYNWNLPGDTRTIDCGIFWLDQIDFTGPPNTVAIKATSVPVITGLKTEQKFKSWEDTTLQAIAEEIATKNGLSLIWDTTKTSGKLARVDQQSPDLEFIRDKAKDASLSIKVYKRQLVIYSEEEYEAKPPVYVIKYGMDHIIGYSFSNKLNETYKKSKNSYLDPKTGKVIEEEFEPSNPPEGTGSNLNINERPDEEDGEDGGGVEGELREEQLPDFATQTVMGGTKAKSKLREKNKREKECQFRIIGNPDYLSGLNVQLLGFGLFDGKWFISSSNHTITSDGYVTELSMRAALEGY